MFFNPFTPKGSPFDKWNRLALDRVKSIKSLLGVKGLISLHFLFCIGCHVNRWSQIAGMKTNSCSLGCSSAISNDVQSIKVVLLQSKVDSMQTEVMHYSIQNLKIPEIIIEFPRLELQAMPNDLFHSEVRLTSFWIGLVSEKKFIVFS